MKSYTKKLIIVLASVSPLVAAAQTQALSTLSGTVKSLLGIAQTLVPLMMALAVVYFIWGLITYIRSAGNPDKASEGKSIMIYGAIALFVMSSIWSISSFLGSAIGLNGGSAPTTSNILPGGDVKGQ